MIEVNDVTGTFQGRLVRSPIIYQGIEPVEDWYFFHAAPNSKLKSLMLAAGPLRELHNRIDAMLATTDSN
jgi:hypothetical protein